MNVIPQKPTDNTVRNCEGVNGVGRPLSYMRCMSRIDIVYKTNQY